jgi:hypothetical protein
MGMALRYRLQQAMQLHALPRFFEWGAGIADEI